MARHLTTEDYQRLLRFRTSLREFHRWSEERARAEGLTPAQHQLLLAIRGHPGPAPPSIGDVAGYLLLKHHSAVGLIDRAQDAGLVQRNTDPVHRATVRLTLTDEGARRLEALSELHLQEVPRLVETMGALVDDEATSAESEPEDLASAERVSDGAGDALAV